MNGYKGIIVSMSMYVNNHMSKFQPEIDARIENFVETFSRWR